MVIATISLSYNLEDENNMEKSSNYSKHVTHKFIKVK